MNIKGEGRNGTSKKEGIRRKEVMIHGHGLREETTRTDAHTTIHQYEECNPHDDHDAINDKRHIKAYNI